MPVVLVAAQRPPTALGSDSGLNLVNAVRVAASPAARGLGVLTLLNDEIQSARDVTKTANWRAHTFRTPDFGILGYADPDGTIVIYREPVRRHAPEAEFEVAGLEDLPRVDIVYAYAGADGALIDAALAAGARGLVCSGIPAGKPTPAQRAALLGAIGAGVPVVLASRAGSGRAILRGKDREAGLIAADTLNAQKARVLLMLALTVSADAGDIRRIFAEY